MDVIVGLQRKVSVKELMLLNCCVGEDFWESLGLQGDQGRSILEEISSEYSLEALMLKLKLQYLATWCKELTHLKRPWCWERLKSGEGDDRGWDGWMASLTWWTWVWARSGCWWWTGKPGVLQSMELQRVGHDWATKLNWKHRGICPEGATLPLGGASYSLCQPLPGCERTTESQGPLGWKRPGALQSDRQISFKF